MGGREGGRCKAGWQSAASLAAHGAACWPTSHPASQRASRGPAGRSPPLTWATYFRASEGRSRTCCALMASTSSLQAADSRQQRQTGRHQVAAGSVSKLGMGGDRMTRREPPAAAASSHQSRSSELPHPPVCVELGGQDAVVHRQRPLAGLQTYTEAGQGHGSVARPNTRSSKHDQQ